MPKGRSGEAVAQIQRGDPSKQIEGNDVLNSHFDHGLINPLSLSLIPIAM